MNENEQLWCDLLHEWHDNTSGVGEPAISLENQAKYLAKKNPIKVYTKQVNRYDEDSDSTNRVDEDRALVCISNVICKYRPHLHMGDYWLDVDFSNGVQQYMFHAIEEIEDSNIIVADAKHPHINHAKPCLGTYQGDLGTAFVECNYIQFMSIVKAFLGTYTAGDTYHRGTAFKKTKLHCQLHSRDQIYDIFSEEASQEDGIDVYTVATDPMRWNWPKDLAAYSTIEIQGQVPMMLTDYWRKTRYPGLEHAYRSDWRDYNDSITSKLMGYVSIAYIVGELSLFQSFEFVRVFLLALKAHYEGCLDDKAQRALTKLANDIYDTRRQRGIRLNTRYNIALDSERMLEIDGMWATIEPYRGANTDTDFLRYLKWGGDKLTNFVVLLRKQAPHKAATNYLTSTKKAIDIDVLDISYKRIRKHACNLALQQLEKDKRRFINELNRPEVSDSFNDVGQGTLFS